MMWWPSWGSGLIANLNKQLVSFTEHYQLPSTVIGYFLQIIIDWIRWVSIGHNDSGVAREYLAACHTTSRG